MTTSNPAVTRPAGIHIGGPKARETTGNMLPGT